MQGEAVFDGERHAIPGVREHDALVGVDGLQRHDLEEAIGGADFEVRGAGFEVQVGQQTMEGDAGPAGGADEVAADGVGDAGEGDELVQGLVAAQVVEGEGEGLVQEAGELQRPLFSLITGGLVLMSMR